jgi:DNA-binding transcriptional LysR family regulator
MNFTHLKAFYSGVKYSSFTQAARELNVSQPTLSLQVQNLEKQYDIPLLKRTKKVIELTHEGKIVFSYAEKIFSLAGEMENKIEDLNSSKSGDLKIGSTPTLAHYMLPNLILELKEDNPNLKLQLFTGLSREVLGKVLDYEYHVGIIGRVSYPSNIIYKELLNPRLCFITADERGSATREYIINEFQKRNIALNNYIDCENASALKNMVHLGMGGGFFPLYGVEKDVKEGKYRCVEILDELSLHIDLVYLLERKKSQTVRSFISALKGYSFP